METQAASFSFPTKTYLRVLSILNPLLILSMGACIGALAFWMFTSVGPQDAPERVMVMWYTLRTLLVLLTLGALVLIVVLVFQLLTTFRSYLKISPEGLEYQAWPTYHIRCAWDDVQALGRRGLPMKADVLLLRQATELGRPITMRLRKRLGMDTQYFIPLNTIDGWPNGKLADALKRYAPQLFTDSK